ncbi:AGC family protein kinase [Tritrichomonas foetus]|uniref:AGC family protein kinase n=1 Tax=Tritrichomonas foetus TaxID=1144522 RepID=A0A1J4KZ91_9EUKA|nr:AGC family protein kinase [Tritrichomonas foetus]|eukprot:OHT14909.1 AGC family protein kinase [Tritrichomonas foetus]
MIKEPSLDQYTIMELLGEGSFSKVYKAKNLINNNFYALKVYPKDNLTERGDEERFQREINSMAFLRHPCVVALHDFFSDDKNFYLVLDLCNGGELFDYICDHYRLDEVTASFIFKQISEAVNYCHSFGVAHRDLKPENIMIDKFPYVKISDFGLCGYISETKLMKTFCGSPCYCSPECLCRVQYDGRKSDLWSMGVILYSMVTGEHPWNISNTSAMLRQILKADFTIPSYVSVECQNLIYNLIRASPNERFTINEVLDHPWLALGKKQILSRKLKPLNLPLPPLNPPSIEELSSASADSSQRSDCGIISPFDDFDQIVPLNLSDPAKNETLLSCLPRLRVRSSSLSTFTQQQGINLPRKPIGQRGIILASQKKNLSIVASRQLSQCNLNKIPHIISPNQMQTIEE